ncbi:glycosyltransferase family 4 protein [Paenisporosarcina sp. NPDC076898]|uniref:glycosyltransferase family 4 protein n=1 Tax=unclassified Paenisporosarcina TaxID=2642018 RepID=UPI003D06295D
MICFAILAHENEKVLINQIKNIKYYNPGCKVVLYNGGKDSTFALNANIPICPKSRPLKKERLGRFFLDIMTWLEERKEEYDYLVNLDSDVMFTKRGYEEYLNEHMEGYDCMGINMGIQHSPSDAPHWFPGLNMWNEWASWQPFFGTDYFCGCLNSMQVYRHEIVTKLLVDLDILKLETLFVSSEIYALEEMLYATLAVRCGGKHRPYPSECAEFVGWIPLTVKQIHLAQTKRNVYFVHPIDRRIDDPARQCLTEQLKLVTRFLKFSEKLKNITKIPEFLKSSNPLKSPKYPKQTKSLTISWGCYQGGVEVVLFNRLSTLLSTGANAHAYFYYGGAGVPLYKDIPHHISSQKEALGTYIQKHQFDIVTYINTIYNIEELKRINYQGKVIFEFHGCNSSILQELFKINHGEDNGIINAIVVPSSYVAEVARANLTNRKDIPIFIALNSINTSVFYNHSSDVIVDSFPKLQQWKNVPIIGWVGRLDPNKNWEKLLSMFFEIKLKNPRVKLAIVSDITTSPDVHLFYEKALQCNLLEDIILLPNVPYEKMPSYYSLIAQSGGVVLSTSFSEGYPLNLLEAQACECPIVCTDIEGSKEIVKDKLTGFTFPVTNDHIGVLHILELLADDKLRKEIGKEARNAVCLKNNLDVNILSYLNWTSSLLSH